jgi:hypothetical protein
MVFRSHPIGACCVRSGRLQGFIPQKLAHFEEHILTLHTGQRSSGLPLLCYYGVQGGTLHAEYICDETHSKHHGQYVQPKRMFSRWSEAARLKSARTAEVACGPTCIGAPRSPTCLQM